MSGTVRPSILAVVDDELDFARLHDRQVRGLSAVEDATGIDANLAIPIHNAGSVAHQASRSSEFAILENGWNCVSKREGSNLITLAIEVRKRTDQ